MATEVAQRELLRLATAGSVDDGKSTLIGRLLLDTKLLLSDQLESLSDRGGRPDLAAVTDGLRAEREQGITIDVAYRYFATPRRAFILADTPGHERYTRNMFTGASTAELAIVLVDARHGVVVQTRRHAQISALLRIRHVIMAINKMDLVDFSEARFDTLAADARALAERVGIDDVNVIPISALDGDNVVERSERMPWYTGPPLLEVLETVDVAADRDLERAHLRLPIQWVARPQGGRRVYTGQLTAGTLSAGDPVVVLPSGTETTIASVDTLDTEVGEAIGPMSVGVTLTDEIDVGRGDMITARENRPPAARELDTTICWMAEEPLAPGRRYALKHTTRTVRATVRAIRYRVDVNNLEELSSDSIAMNEIAEVEFETNLPLFFDSYRACRWTGSLILIDALTNATVGAAMIAAPLVEIAEASTIAATPTLILLPGREDFAAHVRDALLARGDRAAVIDDALISDSAVPAVVRALSLAGVIAVTSRKLAQATVAEIESFAPGSVRLEEGSDEQAIRQALTVKL
jgi:sulfate adenylyltransferase large subunit